MTPEAPGSNVLVGTAGWSIPRPEQASFPESGSALQRYATRLCAAEINSSFYKPHRPTTYARWADAVPDGFRFSVKLPKSITHERRLAGVDQLLDAFLADASGLAGKLGCLLVQLPPKLAFDTSLADEFFLRLRDRWRGDVACEPRHASWFAEDAHVLLNRHRVARAAADPARVPLAAVPGGWPGLVYHRLHGSPRMYFSRYDDDFIGALADRLSHSAAAGVAAWCVFDNTASGAAMSNALALLERLGPGSVRTRA